MKISHVNFGGRTNFIEVRNYPNSILNICQVTKPNNSEFCIGVWKVKRIFEIPSECKKDYVFLKKEE